jgi:ABC-2 type transport system ATP-binding protein
MESILNSNSGINVIEATLRYKEKIVLDEAKLRAEPGEIVGLLGSNGAGKSSFFDILCGINPAATLRTEKALSPGQCIYLSQAITTPAALKMHEIAEMITLMSGVIDQAAMKARRDELIGEHKRSRFDEIGALRSGVCSYGEKRWYIAMCLLAIDRDVYILDEPTSGVDPEYRFYIWQAIATLKKRQKTILVSSHLVNEIADNCDYFYFLVNGKFTKYRDGADFSSTFGCDSLDAAFIRAAQGVNPKSLAFA